MDTTGIKKFISRTLSLAEIKTLSAKAHAAILQGQDVVAITSNSFDGGGASGQLTASALMVGSICEELIEEQEGTMTTTRQMGVRVDFASSYGTMEGATNG